MGVDLLLGVGCPGFEVRVDQGGWPGCGLTYC